jgi:hypothetical protein
MLSRKNYILLGTQAFVAIGLLSGCIVTETTSGSANTGGRATVTVGVGGESGEGGAGVGGSGGFGGGGCVGETGDSVVADCDKLNITPPSHGGGSKLCGDAFDQEPPGYGLCTLGFQIFTAGASSVLVPCLATIGVQDACNQPPLDACIDEMYNALCASEAIATACGDIKTSCGADPLDAVQCAKDLNPLSETGVMVFGKCMNDADPNLNCQEAYNACYAQVFSY